jgi:hypothetical protein
MATISGSTILTIADAAGVEVTSSFVIQPQITGNLQCRCLVYPNASLADIKYTHNPTTTMNFDISPVDKRPRVTTLPTITDNRVTTWPGYAKDAPITEIWAGSGSQASMDLGFFRQLVNYYQNPPSSGFIVWQPKDRTTVTYNIVIGSLTAGGSEIAYDYIASLNLYMLGEVRLTFRILSEV